jgi:hypothetical protein
VPRWFGQVGEAVDGTGRKPSGNFPVAPGDYLTAMSPLSQECPLTRTPVRTAVGAVLGLAAVLLFASPAWAHTEIEIDNPQGGATNVTMTVNAEAENDSAGIRSVQMQLPAGITPAQVTLSSGPAGWTLAPDATGFTVSGAPLPVKTDAKFVVKLAQLPPAGGILTFKTLVTYTDGKVDRWVEEPTTDNPSPKEPAPQVSVKPGVVVAPPSGTPSPTAPATTTAASAAATPKSSDSTGTVWLIVVALVVLAALVAGGLLWRRRGAT